MSIALITKEKSLYLLIFDYIAYTVTEKYVSLMGNASQEKIRRGERTVAEQMNQGKVLSIRSSVVDVHFPVAPSDP